MKQKKVIDIVVPYQDDMPPQPSVLMTDRIIDAVELMVCNGLHRIPVVRNNRPVGMIRLEDAFRELGLQGPPLANRAHHSGKAKISSDR